MTPSLLASNLEQVTGSFDVVTCLDVVIHYDDDKVIDMIKHLAGMAEKKLIISFAPKTPFLSFLKSVGEFFPGKFSCPPHPLPSFADCADSLSLSSPSYYCGFFPTHAGSAKATRAYLHSEEDVRAALESFGFRVTKRDMTSTSFYFSTIFEAVRV